MSAKILIVEDEMLVAFSLRVTLEDMGHECVGIAPDLDTAMQLTSQCPDLALVDLNLRDGLTGPQIGETLCNDHNVAVLFVTANPRVLGDGVAGTIGVLTKPTEREAIAAAVDYAMRVRTGKPATAPAVLKTFAHSA